jgi:hypothetical protein
MALIGVFFLRRPCAILYFIIICLVEAVTSNYVWSDTPNTTPIILALDKKKRGMASAYFNYCRS